MRKTIMLCIIAIVAVMMSISAISAPGGDHNDDEHPDEGDNGQCNPNNPHYDPVECGDAPPDEEIPPEDEVPPDDEVPPGDDTPPDEETPPGDEPPQDGDGLPDGDAGNSTNQSSQPAQENSGSPSRKIGFGIGSGFIIGKGKTLFNLTSNYKGAGMGFLVNRVYSHIGTILYVNNPFFNVRVIELYPSEDNGFTPVHLKRIEEDYNITGVKVLESYEILSSLPNNKTEGYIFIIRVSSDVPVEDVQFFLNGETYLKSYIEEENNPLFNYFRVISYEDGIISIGTVKP